MAFLKILNFKNSLDPKYKYQIKLSSAGKTIFKNSNDNIFAYDANKPLIKKGLIRNKEIATLKPALNL